MHALPRFVCLALFAGLLGACGGDDAPPAKPTPPPIQTRTYEPLDPVPPEEQAVYALERLTRGPRPLGSLRVRDIHRRNLELAIADLVALEDDTLALLEDPERRTRIIGMARRNADPWHNVLRLLLALPTRPVDLVLAWTTPVLELDVEGPLATLRREAARVLAAVGDPRVGDTLLTLFRANPAEREMGVICFPALLHMGSPWREQALDVALEGGSPSLWRDTATRIGGLVPAGEVDPIISDAMTWWSSLVEGSGPRISQVLPRVKNLPWSPGRLALDDAVPHTATGARSVDGVPVYGPLPSGISHGTGWFPADLAESYVFPMYAYILTGKVPAAECRCALALWRYPTYLRGVTADLDLEASDPALFWTARHCMADVELDVDDVRKQLAAELDQGGPWPMERVGAVRRLVSALPGCTQDVDWQLLSRALQEMRPLTDVRTVVERAFDDMQPREPDLVPIMLKLLQSPDTNDRGIALHLIKRSRNPVYLDALHQWLDETNDRDETALLQRTLAWMYAQGHGVEPARYEAFVSQYVAWLSTMPDAEAATFATGLLDFGEPGHEAFARGLQGPRRLVYLQAWPRDSRVVPRIVAEAALAPVDRKTAPGEVAMLLSLAYSSFPDSAAGALAALEKRVDPSLRPLVAPALERVRFRAAVP